jgi:hypothetical protein
MLKLFIDGIVSMVNLFGSKPSVFKVMSTVLSFLPSLVSQAIDFSKAGAKEKLDELLAGLDAYTGTDSAPASGARGRILGLYRPGRAAVRLQQVEAPRLLHLRLGQQRGHAAGKITPGKTGSVACPRSRDRGKPQGTP